MDFEGKVVLVTGASSGIGANTAEYFAQLGASLVLTGRNEENLLKVSEKCNGKTLIVIADVTKEGDCVKIVESAIERFGQLDVLVNNAGILENGSIEKTSLEQYDRIMDTNVKAVYHLTMLATPHLIKSKGNIVNLSSVAGKRSFPGILSYCMSKAAIDQFTKCVALELAPKGVRVNAVNPGVILTEIYRREGMNDEKYQKLLQKIKENSITTHALGRSGDVNEVAACIAFLASNSASFVTGTTLSVDGGRAAMC